MAKKKKIEDIVISAETEVVEQVVSAETTDEIVEETPVVVTEPIVEEVTIEDSVDTEKEETKNILDKVISNEVEFDKPTLVAKKNENVKKHNVVEKKNNKKPVNLNFNFFWNGQIMD